MMDELQATVAQLRKALDLPLFSMGESRVTVGSLLAAIALIVVVFYIAGSAKRLIAMRLLARSGMGIGMRQAVGSLVRYVVLFIGLLLVLQTVGIDLTALTVFAGAVGIGIGFGLQNIFSNFISGLIILVERPIKVGDRIEVGGVEGDVLEIGGRSTTVVTNDEIAIIVPNSKFITENVVNWSHAGNRVRFKIPVIVGYDSDVRLVETLLLEVARENQDVLDAPEPGVRLLAFGDNGILFELRAWSASLLHRRGRLTSALNFAIHEKFRTHRIEMPFPARDVRIRGGALEVRTQPSATPTSG